MAVVCGLTHGEELIFILYAFFMTLSTDLQWAYVLDHRNNYLSRIDMSTGSLMERVRFNQPLKHAYYLEDIERLAVVVEFTEEIFLIDKDTLATLETIQAGQGASGLYLNDNKLFVAEQTLNNVLSHDLISDEEKRCQVWGGPSRFLFSNNYLYVSNYEGGTVAVLDPDQMVVIRTIKTGGNPFEMASSQNRRWIYIADQGAGSISVVDISSNRVKKRIDLAAKPHSIVVL